MADKLHQIGRLAMRSEGSLWVGYYAMRDTMDGALFLGSIRLVFVQDAERKAVFMALMRDAVSDIIQDKTGERPIWPDGSVPAPEHERGGRA
jgi:hypothetical protein